MDIKNQVQLIGHLGSDPIIRELENGRKMAKLSVATNEYYKDKEGEFQERTQWHNVVAWGPIVETIIKRCCKGTEVLISGKLVSRSYLDDKQEKKFIVEVEVKEIICKPKLVAV